MSYTVVLTNSPPPAARDAIVNPLVAFNSAVLGPPGASTFGVLIQNEDGTTLGGLWARTYYQWLFIELLYVPDAMRGQGLGGELLARAEAAALERGCVGAWLDTFNPDALRLYLAQGFEIFGELPSTPPSPKRYFLRKNLTPAAPPGQ